MKLFTITNLVTIDAGIVTVDDVVTGIPMIYENIRISVIFGGVCVALLAVLVFSLYVSLFDAEFRKASR